MWEYHVFLHHYDDPAWSLASLVVVYAPSDEAVKTAYPSADRIYRNERSRLFLLP